VLKGSMRKSLVIAVIVVVACAVLFGFTRSRKTEKSEPGGARSPRSGPAGPQVIPVTVAPALSRDMPVYINGLGTVEAYYTVTVKPRIDGQVLQVFFKEGQDVRKGQVLVQIDPRPYEVALAQAEATLYKDQAQLTIARRNFDRYQDLFRQGVVSRQDLDAQQSNYGALEGTVRADQAAIANAKLNVAYCRITSPIYGRVGLRQVDPGNMVHASDANGLLVITQLHPIATLFTIPEDSLPSVVKAEHAQSKPLEVEVFSRDNRTKLATGNLTTINNQIDTATGTVRLKAVFDNTEGLLWPNQFVNARLLLDVQRNAVAIPASAIQRGVNGAFVFVVGADNSVQVRPVKLGVTDGDLVAVDSGLKPGESVVTDGQDKLQAGSRVQPRPATASPQGQQTAEIPVGL
jgi:multidrug efflux system membrane fusion protein